MEDSRVAVHTKRQGYQTRQRVHTATQRSTTLKNRDFNPFSRHQSRHKPTEYSGRSYEINSK
jgi:hypothetical protein